MSRVEFRYRSNMVRLATAGVGLWLALSAQSCTAPLGAADPLRLNGDSLATLPPGAAHPSVKAAAAKDGPPGLLFSGGSITLPTAGHLTAAAGTVDLRIQMPADWPIKRDELALFHAGGKPGAEVSLMFNDTALYGVYGSGGQYAFVRGSTWRWKPLSEHRLEFSWDARGPEVALLLRVDGQLLNTASGRLIAAADWPTVCTVGARGEKSSWRGLISEATLSPVPQRPAELEPGRRTVTVDADRPVGECYTFWDVGNFNKPQALLDPAAIADYRGEVPRVTELNLVYLLGGRYPDQNCWFKGVGPDGKVQADFSGMIAQLKAAIAYGYKPRIVLDNVPYNMSDPPNEAPFGNTMPPKDERVWRDYVQAAVEAMVQAFGRQRVAGWSFRVGTEPDLKPGHWAGTKEQFLAHYDYTVDAVTRVLPEARIGPGNILNPGGREIGLDLGRLWGLEIIDHAAAGTNYCTGQVGTRLDFFSCSWYARVGRPLDNFNLAFTRMRERLARYPQFAKVPLEAGEFAVLTDEYGRRLYAGETSEWSASFYAALADRVYSYDVKKLYEWDHATLGVMHPRGRVINMLEKMAGGRRLAVSVAGRSAAICGALAARQGEELLLLVYNHRDLRRPQVPESVRLVIEDQRMKAGAAWRMSQWTIDEQHGVWAYAYEADCAAAGLPLAPEAGRYEGNPQRMYGQPGYQLFKQNAEKYARMAELRPSPDGAAVAVGDGRFELDLEMPGHSVRFIRLTPPTPTADAPPGPRALGN